MAKAYIAQNLTNKNFDGSDLKGVRFEGCTLSGTTFCKSNLSNTTFYHCKSSIELSPNFEGANLEGSRFELCDFQNSSFKDAEFINATILNSKLIGSNLKGCRFNGSRIEGLNISGCELHLASFIDAQILSIEYKPFVRIGLLRGHSLFKKSNQIFRTIFIKANEHLEFSNFCRDESRKDYFFSMANQKYHFKRILALIGVLLFGILTNYGTSFSRWILCSISIIILYAILLRSFCINDDIIWHIKSSLTSFFDFGSAATVLSPSSPVEVQFLLISESILGYFMLGVLISLFTSKINSN